MKASEHGGDVPDSVGKWSFNDGGEIWSRDYFATKEEAIAGGREYFGPNMAFEVGRFVELDISPPDADDVIETMCCRASDHIPGDLAELFLENPSKESREELTAALEKTIADWLTKYGEWPTVARVVDIETIGPVEGGEG